MQDPSAWVAGVRAATVTVTPHELANAVGQASAPLIVDVREREEVAQGIVATAHWIPRGQLESGIVALAPAGERRIVVYCESGTRSALAAHTLRQMGYTAVASLAGGIAAYRAAGLPLAQLTLINAAQLQRFARHVRLPLVGEAGQATLLASRVLIVGVGGLGSPVAYYLAAAGVGTLGLVDHDIVDESNLQRQILHTSGRVGMAKVDSAEVALRELWPGISICKHKTRLDENNANALFAEYDLIVDCTDTFSARYLINDFAVSLGKRFVHGSVFQFEGQVIAVVPGETPCYRCVFPELPSVGFAPTCQEAGVFGVVPGVVGTIQANEVIKLLLNIGSPLTGRVLLYDSLSMSAQSLVVRRDPQCRTCGCMAAQKSCRH